MTPQIHNKPDCLAREISMKPNQYLAIIILFFGLLSFSCSVKTLQPISSANKIGVVLMHGKGGDTQWVDPLKSSMEGVGIVVDAPQMPWHRSRIYDKSFDDAMGEINLHVQSLKNQGVAKVYVAGHSLGAVAAAGYAARYDDINGIILMAPGHFTAWPEFHNQFVDDLNKAEKMISDGKGDEKGEFHDLNAGKSFARFVTANIYKSWFSDVGPAEFRNNLANLKGNIPVLYVAGSQDRTPQTKTKDYAFVNAPANKDSHFVIIDSDHLDVPDKADEIVIEWLRKQAK